MPFLRLTAARPRCHGCRGRHGFARVLSYGRDVMLAIWVVGVLAFCVMGLAGAMR